MHSRRDWAAVLTLAVVSLVTFSPAISCQFVNLDDSTYVVQNKSVKAGLSAGGVAWAFTTFDSANWHPLTWLSLQLDATLWRRPDGEPAPAGFHLTNVLLHAANAGLLFLALRGLTGCYWRSVAVALFFAVHPLRVESVAWVAERKDVLSAFFGLLALWAYAGYVRGLSTRRYLAVVIPFVLSLLAKPMLVTLPCLLLVLDWWPLARARSTSAWVRLAIEKLPLFVLAALSSVVTVQAQAEGGAIRTLECFTPVVRAENAVVSYAVYLGKTAWPVGLSVFYPHPVYGYDGPVGPSSTEVAGGLALLVAISVAAIIFRKRAPYLLAGWLWYVGTLVPVIGLVQVGGQAYADRYTYIPQIGVLLALCWGAADLARAWPRTLISATAVAAAVLAVLSVGQLRVWQNSYSLWEHAYHVVEAQRTGVGTDVFRMSEVVEEERQRFVFDFNGTRSVGSQTFVHRGYHGDIVAGPMDFSSRALRHVHRGNARHLLRGRGIDAHHLGMRVRTAYDFAVKHAGAMDVIGVLGAAGNLVRAIDARDALADQRALFGRRPAVFVGFVGHLMPLSSQPPASRQRGFRRRCHSGRSCRPARA